MAFTKEQVDEALDAKTNPAIGFQAGILQFQDSTIYEPVMDYLTGKSSSLPRMQLDHRAYAVVQVLNLLKDIERPSANDHLVQQVMRHPDLIQVTSHFYSRWLLHYALNNKGTSALQAVVGQFRSIGMNDDSIFGFIILHLGFGSYSNISIEKTVVKDYLTEYIRKAKQLAYPKAGYLQWQDDFSMFYFKLLEEVRPEFAVEYALYGVYSGRNCPIVYFTDYRKGYYMPSLLAFLKNRQNPNLQTIQLKLAAAIRLYDGIPEKYDEIAVELSIQYLEYLSIHKPNEKWEGGMHLEEFKETDLSYIPFSSIAYHILLKKDRDKALEILKDAYTKKVYIPFRTLQIIKFHLGKEAFPYIEIAIQADNGGLDHYRKLIGLLQTEFDSSQYLPLIWKLAINKSRPIKELVAKIVGEKDPDAENKAIELLGNKSGEIRQTAALVLTQFSSTAANDAIAGVLHKEANDNARDILLQAVAGTLPVYGDKSFIDGMINAARERNKLNKPIETWLDETLLPSLYDHSGNAMSNEYVRFLLYRMSRVKNMRSDIEAKYIIQLVDKEKTSPFALELIKVYSDKGAKPEHKYLIALAALIGNDTIVDKIRITINKWIDESRNKMAEYGVGALALQGSDKALRWVEWYSRKYKSKKANVGAAALAALETAAIELGITIHELGDKVVPDFGFEGLFKHFIVGSDEYRAFIDSNFKIAYFNESNKKLKSLPTAASAELKEEFKIIGKEVRDIVRSQSSRLEYYLIIQRRWEFEQWQKFFLQNPVMFIYATKLLWGGYDREGKLVQTFLCNEDTSLIDANSEEINIESGNLIGIVHPSQLDTGLLQQWKKQFFDLSIESIFPQLERRMADLNDINLSRAIITKFMDREMATGSIRNTLERYGWHKGPTGDGGMLESFNLLYAEGIEAVLEVEGVGAGYGWGGEEKTGRLYVIDKSKIKQRWFSPPQNDNDERLIKLENVPAIFLSEMLSAVELIKEKEK